MSPAILGASRPVSAEPDLPPERPDDDILEELRERRDYGTKAWEKPREEGRKDVLCVAGDVWQAMDPDGLAQRKSAMRPAVSCDEIGQYLNQTGNDVRQNKRGVKVTPTGNGANDKTAEYRQGRIRQIEYESNAARDVYSPIFEDSLQRSYGFGRIVSKYVSPTSRKQKLLLEAFPNPDVVLPDPDGAMLSQDCSKIQWAFVFDASRTRKGFKREFTDAEVVDFTDVHMNIAPGWIRGDGITLAEYWLVEKMARRVVFLKIDPDRGWLASKLPRVPLEHEIASEEMREFPYVCQYLTNGVELLAKKGQKKRTPWPGPSIPIFSCFGKVLYVQTGAGTERRILSKVRLMREPVMGLAYALTCKVEVIGSVPRATFVAYEGQMRGHEPEWQKANHEPVPYLYARPFTEATGNTLLPLPQRQSWDPPLQNIEMTCESFRRSIQAAAGSSPLPTDAQRQNQKSGKALDSIESSGQKGDFHHVDHLDGMVTRVGVMLNELLPFYDDTVGEVTVRKPDDQSAPQRINYPNDPESVMVSGDHEHDITLSVGPAKESERQASNEFADTIVGSPTLLQTVGPQKAAELTALAIRLKDVGPIGDEMADIIAPKPPDGTEPPTPQMVAELQGQVQQLTQQLQEATTAVQTDQAKQTAQVEIAAAKAQADTAAAQADADLKMLIAQLEAETKLETARRQAETELEKTRMQEATKIAIAEAQLAAKALQVKAEAAKADEAHVHEAGMAAMGHSHESTEAERGREAAAESQGAEHDHAATMAERAELAAAKEED